MRTSTITGTKPTSADFLSQSAIEIYCNGSNYIAIELADAFLPLTSEITAAPKQSIVNVFEGSIAIPSKFLGLHVHNYIASTSTTPRPTIPIDALRTHDTNVHWPNIEQTAGVYTWTLLDNYVSWAESIGAEVCHVLGFTPQFYASNLSVSDQYGRVGASSMPASVTNWTNYVTACAQRYAGRIKYYGIWNEPNYKSSATVGTFFGTEADMVTLASAAYSAIKTADPAAIVLSPAPMGETSGGFVTKSAATWLTDYLAAGGGLYCDEVAFHPYLAFNRDPSYLPTWYTTIRTLVNAAGFSSKPITISEVGNQENYTSNGQNPMGDGERSLFLARTFIYLAAVGANKCYWYDYDGGLRDSIWLGRQRRHGMIDSVTKQETVQCTIWRQLQALLSGATLLRVNRLTGGQLAITTSNGTGLF